MKFEDIPRIQIEEYDTIKTIGTGSFGIVNLIKSKIDSKFYAIKMLKKKEILKLKQVDHINNEINILSRIKHPFLINMTGISQDSKFIYILLEYIAGGELFTYLRSAGNLDNEESNFYASQIVLMFEYLHSKEIVYRDLKPENLLINKNGYLMLTDFGFAKILDNRTYTLCGTPEYLAPEILLQKGHGKAVDWWCLGIIIYEMLVGIDPFSDDDPMQIYQNILKGKVKYPTGFPKNAKSLVRHLLVADLAKRYGNLKNGLDDIKGHRWFKNLNWEDIFNKKIKANYIPTLSGDGDYSCFNVEYDETMDVVESIPEKEDPFIDW